MKNKKKISLPACIEILIRLTFFALYPALFSTAWTGIKMLVETIKGRQLLSFDSFNLTLILLLAFTIVFGRFFCGFACAFGSWGDFVYGISSLIRKKRKKKPFHAFERMEGFLRYGKYLVVLAVLALVIMGKGGLVSTHSPFTAFSLLHKGVFSMKLPVGMDMAGLVIFALITLGMAVEPRFFCRFLCPMGAVFSLMPVLPVSVIKRDRESCIPGCRACRNSCPADLDIPSDQEGDNVLSGECFSCGKCISRCPKSNIHNGLPIKAWLPMLLIKGVLLLGLVYYLYR